MLRVKREPGLAERLAEGGRRVAALFTADRTDCGHSSDSPGRVGRGGTVRIGIDCMIVGRRPSGVEYYVLGLVHHLLRMDQRNEYVLFARGASGLANEVPAGQVVVHESSLAERGRIGRITWEHACLPALTRRYHLDVLHCPAYVGPWRCSVPTVVTVHDTFALDHPQWCGRLNVAYYRLLLKRSIARADRVISVSGASAAAIRRNVPEAEGRIDVIHPGVDEIFAPVREPGVLDRVRVRYGLPPRFVLFVGNLEPRKNLLNLAAGFRQFQARVARRYRLVIVGGKSWRIGQAMRRLAETDQTGSIMLAGYAAREDLPAIYSMAAVLAMVSLDEGFGFPPLEAMACGTPVVASVRGAMAETLDGAVVRVDPESAESIARGLWQATSEEKPRRRLAEAGLQRVRQFTWPAAAAATLETYRQAAGCQERVVGPVEAAAL